MSSHENETVRFLAAYNTAVEQMNKVIAEKDTNPEAYNELMTIAVNNISFPAGTSPRRRNRSSRRHGRSSSTSPVMTSLPPTPCPS